MLKAIILKALLLFISLFLCMHKITSVINNFVLPIFVGMFFFSLMNISIYFRESLCHVCCLYYDK